MPASYTHYKFGVDVLNKLPVKSRININKYKITYDIFNQSFDHLYYYYLFLGFIGRDIRNLGSEAHNKNVNLYFRNITEYIINNNKQNDYLLKSYLYGSINHYILDKTLHPYVFYKTGVYNNKDKKTYKYNGLHSKFEFMLDSFFYRGDTNLNYKNFKTHKEIMPKYKFNNDLKNIIEHSFHKTYNVNNMGSIFAKSYKHERFLYKLVIEDKTGIKNILLKIVDFLTTNKVKNISSNSTFVKNMDYNILNIDKKRWNHPSIKTKYYNDSLLDLYNKAVLESSDIITKFELMFSNKYDIDKLFELLGNNSYITNLDVNKNIKMKYFEF